MSHLRNGLIVAALSIITTAAFASLTDGVLSVWTFDDGTAKDLYGINDGNIVGGVTFVNNGKMGGAADFNGTDSLLEMPFNDSFKPLADAYTAAAWINIRAGQDHGGIIWLGQGIGWGPLYTFRIATTSDTGLTWGGCTADTEGWFASDGVYNVGEWTHVAITSDGTNITAYVNGEIVTATGGGSNPNPVAAPYVLFPDQPLRIGMAMNVGGDPNNKGWVDGLVDEAAVYTRALSQDEVKELMGHTWTTPTAVDPAGKVSTTWASLKTR